MARGETWAAEVSDGVAVLTAGIDTQDARLEVEIVGWEANEESWSVAYEVIDGDLDDPETVAKLDAFLQKTWHRADGRTFTVKHACMDSGGHKTQAVCNFSKARLGRRIIAIKGESARGGARSLVWPTKRPTNRSKASFRPVIIGVNSAKDIIRSRLAMQSGGSEGPIPGYMHFPATRDVNYYAHLVAESSVTKTLNGSRVRLWIPSPRRANEALDCGVYAYASLCALQYAGFKLNIEAARVMESIVEAATPVPVAR